MLSSYRGNSNALSPLTSGKPILAEIQGGGVGLGTVLSVGLTAPAAEFSVAGSPVTTTGALAISKKNQNANLVWAGPTNGAAAQPTFRALVAADLPPVTAGIDLETNGNLNSSQVVLNLVSGANVSLADL